MKPYRPLRFWIPYLVLAMALLATLVASYSTAMTAGERDQAQFQALMQRHQNNIGRRLDTYIAMLRATAAFFTVEDTIGRRTFHEFVERLQLTRNYPGIQGMGFAEKVTPQQREPLMRELRGQGRDSFRIWPPGEREVYFPIVHLEPEDARNLAAIGFDMYAEPTRRAAMKRAGEEGIPVASARVTLVQEIAGPKQPGFLVYVPVYAGVAMPTTFAERGERLAGFIYAPFRASDLLSGIYREEEPMLDIEVYDGQGVDRRRLLYSSDPLPGAPPPRDRLFNVHTLDMYGRIWTLRFTARPEFTRGSGSALVPYIFVVGTLISVLLFGVTRSQLRALQSTERIALDLRRSEERYRVIIETAPDVIYTIASDGTIASLSPAFEQLTGWRASEWVGKPFAPLIHPDDLLLAFGSFQELMEGKVPPNYELRVVMAGGGYLLGEFRSRPQIENGMVIGAIGIARDITDARRAVEALRQSEERYRAFVENSTEAIWRFEMDEPLPVDLPEDEQVEHVYRHAYLAECNVVMARMYGFTSPDEIVGARLDMLLIRSNPDNLTYLRNFIRSGYRLNDALSHETDREGNALYFINNLVGVVENGMVARAWGTQRDVTERLKAEQERERLLVLEQQARAEAQAASRAKDQFLAVLSHELRTPLTPVLAAMEFLHGDPELPEHARSMLEIIDRNVLLEARLIDDLLDLTGIVNGKMQLRPANVDAHELLHAAVDIAGGEIAQKRIDLRFLLDATRHRVFADPARLQQVFWNLVKNAVKFTPDGGMVTVRTSNREGKLVVEIRDTGIGIESGALSRIFNPFEQGEQTITRRFGGLGLGLAISKMLIDMHGGSLSAWSEGAGAGATFIVELDTVDDPLQGDREGVVGATSEAPETLSILYVEDHEDTARVIGMLLKGRGYRVTSASDLAGALDAAEQVRYDLLISDIGLPDGTGLELMRALRARGAVLGGIAISGFGTKEDIRRSLEAGFDEHLTKPVNFRQLEEAINRWTSPR